MMVTHKEVNKMTTIDATTAAVAPPKLNEPARQVEQSRAEQQSRPQTISSESKIPPEELLQQINAITEAGTYSVRFEKDRAADQLIVKIVDQKTDEVIRQIPPEELRNLSKQLQELSGNIVNTVS